MSYPRLRETMRDGEGEVAVRMARKAVEAEVKGQDDDRMDAPASFREKRGVFVTLSTYPEHDLRGCIGFPEPVFSLASAIIQAAHHACHDPRFDDLTENELNGIVVEVTVLTVPERLETRDRKTLPSVIKVGCDGLIVERGSRRGLLLPQVPVEWGWDAEEFLAQTCIKAGLLPDMWLDERTTLFRFGGEIFAEESPRGRVVRKEVNDGACG